MCTTIFFFIISDACPLIYAITYSPFITTIYFTSQYMYVFEIMRLFDKMQTAEDSCCYFVSLSFLNSKLMHKMFGLSALSPIQYNLTVISEIQELISLI